MKYLNTQIVFREIPSEISLAINITNCPIHCKGCHSKWLWKDIGNELNTNELDNLIQRNKGISCICFMGGDSEPDKLKEFAIYIRNKYPKLKIGWYSGRDEMNDIYTVFDYIKIGHYNEDCGPLDSKTTNQRMYINKNNILEDITSIYWKEKP